MNIIETIKYKYTLISNRIKSESPQFFKTLKQIAYTVGASSVAVITANTTFSLALPATLITILSYVIAVCVAIAGTSQLTTKE